MDIKKKVFRFNFENETIELLKDFCKLHLDDSREDYKYSWNLWTRSNLELLEKETKRLNDMGYDGDVEEKMFKAAKYYFGKKCKVRYIESTSESDIRSWSDGECERHRVKFKSNGYKRNYVCVSHELITAMDEHIKTNILDTIKRPADGYTNNEKTNPLLIAAEINSLMKLDNTFTKDFISKKIKKTYKNRYYLKFSVFQANT